MKKTLALVVSVVLVVAALFCLVACDNKEIVTVWVSETDGVTDLTETQIERYIAAHPDAYDWNSIKIKVEGQTESDSASLMIADVSTGPDIYCFAQDQLARLVEAQALAEITGDIAASVKSLNDAGSVAAASVAGKLYCFPITSDNGYFMYYDKSVVKAEHIDDLASIVADCKAADKLFSFELEGSAWYTASFFFATGCHSNWTTNADGKFVSVDDTFNSAAGLIALRGMQILTSETAVYNNSSKASDLSAGAAVVVSGTWDSSKAKEALKDNYAVADLPSFTVDGQSYHLGSYSGNKLMGVKPQTAEGRGAALLGLANYLAGEECQLERFNLVGWGPSNIAAQGKDEVKSDPALAALAAQSAYATPQGQIHGSWWDYAKTLGTAAKNANKDDVAALQGALNSYASDNQRVLSYSDEELAAWYVIGDINDTGWGTDFDMEKTASADGTETWKSKEAFELAAGTKFKIRQGHGWGKAFGSNEANADTKIPLSGKPDYVVETAGKYYIEIVITLVDGAPSTAVVNLIAA